MAVNGIISGIGDKENNINQILPELDASILAVLLESGVYYAFSDDITVDFDLCKVNVPKFFCIASGFKVYFDTPTELFFTKPVSSSDTFYYHVLVEVKTNVVPNTSKLIIIRNDGEDLPEEYYRQDDLIKIKGIFYLEITSFEVVLSNSGTQYLSFFNKISKVNAAISSDVTTRLDGIMTRSTTGVTQSKGTANETIATTRFVRDAINFGNDTIRQNTPSGDSTTISVNELTRIGGLVLGKYDYSIKHNGSGYLRVPFKIGTLPEGYRPKTPSNFSTTAFAIINIDVMQGTGIVPRDVTAKCDITIDSNYNLYLNDYDPSEDGTIRNQIKKIHIYKFMFGYTAEDI